MDVSTSFCLCSLLAVVSMSMTIGCLWCCICVMARIVKMTMLFTHGGLGLSQSLVMVCKAERIAFSSASSLLQCCPHASLMSVRVASGYWMVRPYPAPPHSEPIHRCRHASLCLDTCRWSQLPSFSVCAWAALLALCFSTILIQTQSMCPTFCYQSQWRDCFIVSN